MAQLIVYRTSSTEHGEYVILDATLPSKALLIPYPTLYLQQLGPYAQLTIRSCIREIEFSS